MTTAEIANLLDRAATLIREKAGSVRKDFSTHLLSAECAKAAHALRETDDTPRSQ